MGKVTVLIADDHAIVRTGLATLLEAKGGIAVVGEAADGNAAVQEALRLKPDVVVMDVMMPVKDGIEATREIVAALPGTRVLILTTSTVAADITRAMQAGAFGAISKATDNDTLADAIKAVAAGRRTLSPDLSELIENDRSMPDLTERQLRILELVSQGLSNPEIAKALGVTVITIKKHMESILTKLDAANRSEAITIAMRNHLLPTNG